MTDKQAVVDALERLPEGASLEEITEELRIMAAIRRGRADLAAGRARDHEEVEMMVESWARGGLQENLVGNSDIRPSGNLRIYRQK